MARRYRRYKRQESSLLSEFLFLVILIVVVGGWQLYLADNSILIWIGISLALTLLIIGCLALRQYRQAQRKLRALDIAAIDAMDPLEFEVYVGKLLKHRGFSNIRITEKYDYGVDIIAQKDGLVWGVQVKRYGGLVKADAVRQVVTALIRYKCDRAMVVTNSTFSRPARELAADNKCVLIGRDELAEWIVDFQEENK